MSRAPANPQGRRRRDMASDMTVSTEGGSRSVSLSLAIIDTMALEEKLAREAGGETEEDAIKRMISIRSTISTKSAFAQREQAAVGKDVLFREIGTGSIGKVFEHSGTVRAYKLPLLDGDQGRAKLWNNYLMQVKVREAFDKAEDILGELDVNIPQMFWYANNETSGFWAGNLDKFPSTPEFPKKARDVVCMERIMPVRQPLRDMFVDKFHPGNSKDKADAKLYQANQDCLVRPLLGRRRYGTGSLSAFSLRNFTLHLDQFAQMKVHPREFLLAMADTMAILHFVAQIDGEDIEFVVGSAPTDMRPGGAPLSSSEIINMTPGTSTFEQVDAKDFTRRALCLWVIDFDACNAIKLDDAGCQKAVAAFMKTAPYCPRPSDNANDNTLWKEFGGRYYQTSIELGGPGHKKFAEGFLTGIAAAVKDARSKASSASPASSPGGPRPGGHGSPRGRGSHRDHQGSPRGGGSPSRKTSWSGHGKKGDGGGGFMSGNWRDTMGSES